MCSCNKSNCVWNTWTSILLILLLEYTTGYDPTGRLRHRSGSGGNRPNILSSKQNYTFYEGNLVVMSCAVEKLGTKTVVWRKVSEPNPLTVGKVTFVADPRIQTHHVVHKELWNLHIRNVKKTDAGTYECQISTKERNLRKTFHLDIRDKEDDDSIDHAGIIITGNFHVEIGDTLHMKCNATDPDIPLTDISWFKDGSSIQGSDRTTIRKKLSIKDKTITSDIYIHRVEMSDSGYYLCRITDDLTTHKHVQVLNTANNKDKRGTLIDAQVRQSQNANKKNSAKAKLPGKLIIFIAFMVDLLRNAL